MGFLGSRAQAQWLWCLGPGAPWHVGFSGIRDGSHVPCIGRQILIHSATREARTIFFLMVMDSVGQQLESGMVERDYFCSTISGFSSGKTSLAG